MHDYISRYYLCKGQREDRSKTSGRIGAVPGVERANRVGYDSSDVIAPVLMKLVGYARARYNHQCHGQRKITKY